MIFLKQREGSTSACFPDEFEKELENHAEDELIDLVRRNVFLKANIWPRIDVIRTLIQSRGVKSKRVSCCFVTIVQINYKYIHKYAENPYLHAY